MEEVKLFLYLRALKIKGISFYKKSSRDIIIIIFFYFTGKPYFQGLEDHITEETAGDSTNLPLNSPARS